MRKEQGVGCTSASYIRLLQHILSNHSERAPCCHLYKQVLPAAFLLPGLADTSCEMTKPNRSTSSKEGLALELKLIEKFQAFCPRPALDDLHAWLACTCLYAAQRRASTGAYLDTRHIAYIRLAAAPGTRPLNTRFTSCPFSEPPSPLVRWQLPLTASRPLASHGVSHCTHVMTFQMTGYCRGALATIWSSIQAERYHVMAAF